MDSLRIPILGIGDILIASIQTELHDTSAVQCKDDLIQPIYTTRAQTVCVVARPGRTGIEIVCECRGPGIANLDLVMQDGYSTSRGMGMGLPDVRHLMSEFSIRSKEDIGTTLTCRTWRW